VELRVEEKKGGRREEGKEGKGSQKRGRMKEWKGGKN